MTGVNRCWRLPLALGLGLTIGAVIGLGARAQAWDPTGLWKTAESDGRYLHVRIAACASAADQLCGTIEGAFGGASVSTIGKPIVWDMEADGDGAWSSGRVWAPDEDETYRAKMAMKAADVLELSGCVLGGLICRGQDWIRVE
ncbi:MAG: DUF2147 domain-containing protein [Pseudomonadota bacterium]